MQVNVVRAENEGEEMRLLRWEEDRAWSHSQSDSHTCGLSIPSCLSGEFNFSHKRSLKCGPDLGWVLERQSSVNKQLHHRVIQMCSNNELSEFCGRAPRGGRK